MKAGASQAVGTRWFRQAGGFSPIKQVFAHFAPQRMNHKKVARLMRLAGIEDKTSKEETLQLFHWNACLDTKCC